MKKVIHLGKISFVLLLIFGGLVSAQGRWELVTISREGSSWYIDADSIAMLSSGRYLVWRKIYLVGRDKEIFLKGALKGIKDAKKLEYAKSRIEIDCPLMKSRNHSHTYYTSGGDVLKTETIESPKWHDSDPDSLGWAFMQRVCTKVYDGKEM